METDRITRLVYEAYAVFNATSIFEVIDLNKHAAREFIRKAYDNPAPESIERYFCVVERLR